MERPHYESYEATKRPQRRYETTPAPTSSAPQDAHVRAGYVLSHRHINQHNANTINRHSHYSSRPSSDRYDPRYHALRAPSTPSSPSTPTSSIRGSRSPLRKRRSWPPQPCAEDEVTSLRKEAGAQKLLKEIAKDDVPSRGSIDQDPLIAEVPGYQSQNERRFVWSGSERGSTGILTPPTSEDERAGKTARRRPSRLNISKDDESVPEMAKRTASPYAYKPSNLKREESSGEYMTPPSSQSSRLANPSSARRDSGRHSPSARPRRDYFASGRADDSAIDDSEHDRYPQEKKPLSGNGKRVTDLPISGSPMSASFNTGTPPPANAPPIRRANLDARRNTDTQNTLPTMNRLSMDKTRRHTPLMASTSLAEAHDVPGPFSASLDPRSADPSFPRSREGSHPSSRPNSRPVSREGSIVNGMAGSPRRSVETSREGSILGSRPPSATPSRPSSPSPRTPGGESPHLPKTDLDWTALLTANAARRARPSSTAKPPSRLASTVTLEVVPDFTPRRPTQDVKPPQASNTLPYPEDSSLMGSGIFMPDDKEHAYYPPKKPSISSAFPYDNNGNAAGTSSPARSTASQGTANLSLPVRPGMTRGHSATNILTEPRASESTSRRSDPRRSGSFADTSQARKEIAALVKKGLPPCPRQEPVAGKDDWYTIIGHTNIDFCPDCIDTLFERTVFRPSFRRSLPRNYNDKVRCAFGSPWIRLGWLLTLQQQRTDLALLQDIADIEDTSTPCPGGVESIQNWYGLRDPDGLFVRDFHLCYGDVRKIECLLPSLSGVFVRLPQRASYTKSTCAIRTDSTRFSTYLDALVTSHERALKARKNADPMPLIALVEKKTLLRECTRDNVLIGGLWHFIPELTPAMTVCEDCFESVVEPEIKKNKSVAKKFNRTVQPVYNEGPGCSCQLYSPYMRKAFQRAVEDSDTKYLTRKSKERREAELYLQDKFKTVMARAKRLSMDGTVELGEDDERRLNRDLEKISQEWKERWE